MSQDLIMSREVPAPVADTDNLHITVTALQRDAGRSDSMPPRAGRAAFLRQSGCGDP